jgi:hypothetical protein
MTTTDDEIRDLLRAVRRAERPSRVDRAAVRATLAGALVSSVAVPTLATAAKAAAIGAKSSAWGTLLVPFLTGAVLGSGVSASVFLVSRASSVASAPAGASGAAAAPSAAVSRSVREPVPVTSAALAADGPAAPQASARPAPGNIEGRSGPGAHRTLPELIDPLEAESRAVAEVQRALRDGRPAQALALLEVEERARPTGALAEERAAARVFALCALGDTGAAARAAAEFLQRFPRSPLGERVRASCAPGSR